MGVKKYELSEDICDQIQEVIEEYKCQADVLVELPNKTKQINRFDARSWYYWYDYSRCTIEIDFSALYDLAQLGVIRSIEIDLIKCYLIYLLNDGFDFNTVKNKLKILTDIIEKTQNFNQALIEASNEFIIDYNGLSQIVKSGITDYPGFLEYNDVLTTNQQYFWDKVETELESHEIEKAKARILPPMADILKTGFYIDKFFREEEDEDLKDFFAPVYIWWKITNVIPMRPTEFAHGLEKECLIEDTKYYIKINRIKQSKRKNKREKKTIPLLDKYEITEDIFNMMKSYYELVSEDESRETFFSYKYHKELAMKLQAYDIIQFQIEEPINRFVLRDFQKILDEFYRVIILGKYQDNSIQKKLRPGDTRHLAFCSLMLQGLSPVEIALMGGHKHIASQNHYVGHAKYYISSEILKYLSQSTAVKSIEDKGLKKIIFDMSKRPPKNLESSFKTEEGIGYCMADSTGTVDNCEHPKCCIFCSKWWCAPINDNYIKAKEYIEKECIEPLEEMIEQEEAILKKLLKTSKIVYLDELIEIDKSDDEEIRKQGMLIRSHSDEIIFLKKKLIDLSSNIGEIKDEGSIWLGQN